MRDKPKPFLEHLGELRRRIFVSAFATLAGTIISFILKDRLFDIKHGLLMLPLRLRPADILAGIFGAISRMGLGSNVLNLFQLFFLSKSYSSNAIKLFAASPAEKFIVTFKASFIMGALLAAPIIIYEIWAFVLPALKQRETHYLMPIFFITLFFFLIGAIFAFLIVSPVVIPVLAGILPSIENQWRLDYYLSFLIGLMLAFGLAFELPMVMGFIAKLGLISATTFRKQRRLAVVLIFIASGALTPQDPFSMILMAVPLLGLYELGIRLAILVGERKETVMLGG